ncbi:MAG: class IV adenylate cyclase [Blastocatellia bacterium]|nr:class IV adenylate cyclase [Blastocatellia bacterium]
MGLQASRRKTPQGPVPARASHGKWRWCRTSTRRSADVQGQVAPNECRREGKVQGKKVREEVETTVGQPAKTVKILKRLGFQRSFRYQKYRTCYTVRLDDGRTLQATFDETPIGNYIELEGDAATIETVAELLGYPSSAFISESYVEMQVARCAGKGEPLSDLLFPRRKKAKKPVSKKSETAAASSPDGQKTKSAGKGERKSNSGQRKPSRRSRADRSRSETKSEPSAPDARGTSASASSG